MTNGASKVVKTAGNCGNEAHNVWLDEAAWTS